MYQSIHNVETIEVTEARRLPNTESYARDIVIYTEDGQKLEITMFSDNAEGLKMDVAMAQTQTIKL